MVLKDLMSLNIKFKTDRYHERKNIRTVYH